MYDVKDECYYHINTGQELDLGAILEIGHKYNKFYNEIYNSEHLENNKDANSILLEMVRAKTLSFQNQQVASIVLRTVSDSAMITRELMFEETRKEINENLPSRLKCLYVCKTESELKTWCDIFKRTNKKKYQILKLKLTGKIFLGDASLILRQNISLNKKKEQAYKYWHGDKKDNINEYLFIGTAEVVKIINNI